jgi:hypothetical protein
MGRAPASVSDAYSSAEVSRRSRDGSVEEDGPDTDLSSTDSDTGAGVALEPVAGSVPEAEGEQAPSALRTVTSGEVLDPEPAPPSASLAAAASDGAAAPSSSGPKVAQTRPAPWLTLQ